MGFDLDEVIIDEVEVWVVLCDWSFFVVVWSPFDDVLDCTLDAAVSPLDVTVFDVGAGAVLAGPSCLRRMAARPATWSTQHIANNSVVNAPRNCIMILNFQFPERGEGRELQVRSHVPRTHGS